MRLSLPTTTWKQLEKNWLNDLTSSKRQKTLNPNIPQIKRHLLSTPTPCDSRLWWGKALQMRPYKPPQDCKAGHFGPSCRMLQQPVYGVCNGNSWPVPLHRPSIRAKGGWRQTNMPSVFFRKVAECLPLTMYWGNYSNFTPRNSTKPRIPGANPALCPLSTKGSWWKL